MLSKVARARGKAVSSMGRASSSLAGIYLPRGIKFRPGCRSVVSAPGEAALKHTPYGKQGSGFYTDATRGCFDVIARLRPPLLAAIEEQLSRRSAARDFATPFRIMDLGTADAGTSLPLIRDCIKLVRASKGFEGIPIEIIYEDQPGNDWISVFARTQGTVATPNVPPEAHGLKDFENVYVLASGTSFYDPAVAPGTLDAAFCATAFHWLSNTPKSIPDALHSACTQDPATLAEFQRQADADWRTILSARARELKPGARLVIANFAKDENGYFLGYSSRVESMHHNFANIWKELVTPAEFVATNFPNHYRSLEECAAPFAAGSFEGLKLVSAETAIVDCPYLDGYLADPSKRTPMEQALHYVPTTRTWSNSTFLAGLGANRSAEEKDALVDDLFHRYAEHVAKNTSKNGMDYVHSYLVMEKESPRAQASARAGPFSGQAGAQTRSMATTSGARAIHTATTGSGSVMTWQMPCGADIHIATARELSREMPGNGGLRIWEYASNGDAVKEAIGLAQGMEKKHGVYNTGFAGAKVVVNSSRNAMNELTINKSALMHEMGDILNGLDGSMYTGCDMNSDLDDMELLATKTPCVLAGIPNKAFDPNDATAFGVLGALGAVAEDRFGGLANASYVVHGLGNVGGVVARELAAAGAKVYVFDVVKERSASLPGTTDLFETIIDNPDWVRDLPEHDVFVPCSISNLLDVDKAAILPAKIICGAANIPFDSDEARDVFVNRGLTFIPESITSAGAVIADSIEFFDLNAFKESEPREIANFTQDVVAKKTHEALAIMKGAKHTVPEVVRSLSLSAATRKPIGSSFGSFLQQKSSGRPFGTRSCSTRSKPLDVCIVGSGIMGMNVAYQMKRRDPSLNIEIHERASSLGYGSSGWSTGFLRAFYSFDETMELALDGIHAYQNWGAYTGLGDKAEAYFTQTGALWMLGKSKEDNLAIHERLKKYNVESDVLDADGIKKRFPALSTEPYPDIDMDTMEIKDRDWGELWAVHEHGCGHMDSSACLRDMQAACEQVGVKIHFNSHIQEVLSNSSSVNGVKFTDGSVVNAGVVVNCAGPWFEGLNKSVGVKTSTTMLPTRIQVGHKTLPDDEDLLSLPFVADFWGNSGIYFMPRRANKQLVFGSVAHRFESEIVNPDDFNEALDPDVKQDYLSCLFHRVPSMPQSGNIQGFSHMYTVNQEDVHPVIGPAAEVKNYYLCNGFSGHGFKLAPAVGSLMSQQVLGTRTSEWETKIALDFMDPNRKPLSLKVKTHFA